VTNEDRHQIAGRIAAKIARCNSVNLEIIGRSLDTLGSVK